jgi:hypothetical protein
MSLPDMAMSQALALTSDLKLGWYCSIPPKEMFATQIIGTILGAFSNCQSIPTPLSYSLTSRRFQFGKRAGKQETVFGW